MAVVFSLDVFTIRALLFEVYARAPGFWKLLYLRTSYFSFFRNMGLQCRSSLRPLEYVEEARGL